MGAFSLSDMQIALGGIDSPVRSGVEEIFQLTWDHSASAKENLEAYYLKKGESLSMLPGWVRDHAEPSEPNENVFMFYGPTGDVATIAVDLESISCAWASASFAEMKLVSRNNTDRPVPMSASSVLVPILREALSGRKALLLHAAALRCPDATGVMILADGGGGKTTTSLSLLRQGARMLADDLVIGRKGSDKFSVQGFPEHMNLTESTVRFFPELSALTREFAHCRPQQKIRVNPQNIYGPDCWQAEAEIGVIYFVHVTEGEPFVKEIAPAEALGKLIKAHTFAKNQKLDRNSADQLMEIVTGVRSYHLGTGSDPIFLGKWLNDNCGLHAALKGKSKK
jgi:hypothetical protein